MKLNGIFKDNMVFQRNQDIRIFGETKKTKSKIVRCSLIDSDGNVVSKGETKDIYTNGSFLVELPPMPKGGPYSLVVKATREPEVTIGNVYIGEVWIAGGQSNMEYPLIRSEFASMIVPRCPDTNIHFYNIPAFGNYNEEQAEAEEASHWDVINKDTCGDMSAVAFYFAKRVLEVLKDTEEDLHIGIIGCYLGGTNVACWQSIDSLMKTKEGKRYITEFSRQASRFSEEEYLEMKKEYDAENDAHIVRLNRLLKKNPYMTYGDAEKEIGSGAWPPPCGYLSDRRPGALFDTMVLRIVPYSVKGVIFYQGETDADDHADEYAVVFRTLIEEWRDMFCNDDMPFIFCQLPMYITRDRKFMGYDDLKWPKLRAQQHLVARTVPNTYMAVLADCGEFDNIHPCDKKTPGERLAHLALRFIYGKDDLPAVAPFVVDIRRGDGVEVTFGGDFTHLNLVSEFSCDDSGFEIQDEKGEFHPATAVVDFDGKTVLINCREVEMAYGVRYAFFSYGMANLITDTGLAAAPFRATLNNTIGEFY